MSSDTLTVPPAQEPPRPRVHHVLRVLFPKEAVIPLTPGTLQVGREADLSFPDPAMSRRHAELRLSGAELWVRDLGSHNGTWLDGRQIAATRVGDGEVLRLGGHLMLHRVEPVEIEDADVPGLLGSSPAIRATRVDLARIAPTAATVLLLGETGTGKTVAAAALHTLSRRPGRFIHVNSAAIPEGLAESTLFGHQAGAYTDARTENQGMIRAANRGTLFLDELALLSSASQARLLVALESGAITPLGSVTPQQVNVRFVVATNEDLVAALEQGRFRRDLYSRLADFSVAMPPLRARREDLLPLLRAAMGPGAPALTADVADRLLQYPWPGNVRELAKAGQELIVRADGRPELGPELLDARFWPRRTAEVTQVESHPVDAPPDKETLETLLRASKGNVSEVARRVGRSTKQVYRWCERHGIDADSFRS